MLSSNRGMSLMKVDFKKQKKTKTKLHQRRLCSPWNTLIPVVVAAKKAHDQMLPGELQVLVGASTFMDFFSFLFPLPQNTPSWDFVLRSEAFEAISDLLNLLLKWHSHFCSLSLFFFFFLEAKNNPPWHNLWSIFFRVKEAWNALLMVALRTDGTSRRCLSAPLRKPELCLSAFGRLFFHLDLISLAQLQCPERATGLPI